MALALLSAVAIVTAQMVIQSTKLIDTVARSSRNPDLSIATEWIRRDFYEAVSVTGFDLIWTDGPLIIHAQNGGMVAIAAVEGQLIRTHAPPGGLITDTRVILRGVEGWRWSVSDEGVVDIELATLNNPEAYQNLGGKDTHRVNRRTEKLVLALRGKPGGRAW